MRLVTGSNSACSQMYVKPSILVFSFVRSDASGPPNASRKNTPSRFSACVHAREIAAHLVARLEAEIAEVERADDVDAARCSPCGRRRSSSLIRARAVSGNRATRLRRPQSSTSASMSTPMACRARTRAHPLAREARGAAKVLAQAHRLAAAQRTVRVSQKLRLDVDGLHGPFVEIVDVGLLGHRDRKLLLRRGYHVVYLEPINQGGRSL